MKPNEPCNMTEVIQPPFVDHQDTMNRFQKESLLAQQMVTDVRLDPDQCLHTLDQKDRSGEFPERSPRFEPY